MLDIKPSMDLDICTTSIENGIAMFKDHRPSDNSRVFFVAFTPAYRIFTREYEVALNHGYDAVKFLPKDDLPSNYAWDLIMYSSKTGEAIARISHRPTR